MRFSPLVNMGGEQPLDLHLHTRTPHQIHYLGSAHCMQSSSVLTLSIYIFGGSLDSQQDHPGPIMSRG